MFFDTDLGKIRRCFVTMLRYLWEVKRPAWDKGKWFIQELCQRHENTYKIIRLAETISKSLPGSQGLTLCWIPHTYAVPHAGAHFLCYVPSFCPLPFLNLMLWLFFPLPLADRQVLFQGIGKYQRPGRILSFENFSPFPSLLRRWKGQMKRSGVMWWMLNGSSVC